MKREKAVSPVISTVLLILIVVVLAVIILLWSRGFIKEAATKQILGQTKSVEQFCNDIQIKSIYNDDGTFGFQNVGQVPIYSFNVKFTEKDGSSRIENFTGPDGAINPGFSKNLDGLYSDYDQIKIIPILLGKTKSGMKPVQCPDSGDKFVI